MILSSPYSIIKNPIIPIEQTRAAFLKETGIDLYDTFRINRASYFTDDKSRSYYMITTSDREMLIDPETGEILYERGYSFCTETIPGVREEPGSAAYLKSERIVNMKWGQGVYGVFRKYGSRDKNRFYEIFVEKSDRSALVSFLLDHKKNKILHRFKTGFPNPAADVLFHVGLWDEYQQYLKMIEAEEAEE